MRKIIQKKINIKRKLSQVVVFFTCLNFGLLTSYALVMQGGQYSIEFDSLNTGGKLSNSTGFSLEDTAGEMTTGFSGSASYNMQAGYQQPDDITISISAPADINMTPLTVTQKTSVGTASWSVITNSPAGYNLSLSASTNPAMKGTGGRQFTDQGTTPATWSVSNAYKFGFSLYGPDIATATYGTDTDCINTANVPSATLKWRGFTGTTSIQIVNRSTYVLDPGSATTMCVATEQNGVFAPSDTYTATITATAATN